MSMSIARMRARAGGIVAHGCSHWERIQMSENTQQVTLFERVAGKDYTNSRNSLQYQMHRPQRGEQSAPAKSILVVATR